MVPNALLKFTLFGNELSIQLYGIFIAIGIVGCLVILYLYTAKKGMPTKLQDYIFFIGIFAIAIGFLFAKLFQAFYNWIEDGVFDFARAGITVMGGILGGAGAFLLVYFLIGRFYFKGKDKGLHVKQFNSLFNVAPCCITLAHAFGRLGCLMAGCCHGELLSKTEYVVGGIWMKGVKYGWGYYVPAQLYEAIFLFLLFAVLTILYLKDFNINFPVYLASYGIWRFVIEFFRGDDRGGAGALSPSQWQSFIFLALAVLVLAFYLWKKIPLKGRLKCELETAQVKAKNKVAESMNNERTKDCANQVEDKIEDEK